MAQVPLPELYYAWEVVRRGSRSPGLDGITTDLFAGVRHEQLALLQLQLLRETYRPQPARGLYLPKASGGRRLIGIPTVRDRIVQRWLLELLYTPLEAEFADCSYAYRPGRGIQSAVRHLYFYYQYQPAWVIKADIWQFFDRLCWALLLNALAQLPLDPLALPLLEQLPSCGPGPHGS